VLRAIVILLSLAALAAAAAEESGLFAPPHARLAEPRSTAKAFPAGKPITIPTPLGLPPVPIPADNPPTAETIALGRKLFQEKLFSRDNSISCSTCHDPKTGFADSSQFSLGFKKQVGGRHSMTLLNAAYHLTQFWDGRALSLEQQAEFPVRDPKEMAHSLVGVERRLSASPEYVRHFAQAWGPGPITYEMVAKSLASFERTLLSGNSPFDRYYYGGDKQAMSASAIRGLELFKDFTLDGPNCISCHRIEDKFATFTEPRFHNTGVSVDPATGQMRDLGRFEVTGEKKDQGAFKVLTLRNVALTAPYMHDGSMKTLEEVVDFYFQGGRKNPYLSGVVPHAGVPNIPAAKRGEARADLVAFMKALTGDMPTIK
jgi:cytochrome c peroxidase